MSTHSLPILELDTDRRAGTRMGRRRALVLVLVHALIAVHIALFLSMGVTMAPLEPSEASYTISQGFLNAGAIFFVLLIISTLVFGRFFCGWACHVVALQDAARWLLIKLGLRPAPIRARLLMFVPLFAAFWLFGLPIIERVQGAMAGEPGPNPGVVLHLTTDDFWRTFPGPVMTIITFVVCGGLAVVVFGSKGFCTYGCPYGGLFALADRVAKGRIRVNDNCVQSGECTRNCSSGVDVASEVAQFGMVVDPGCMKCMDCVAGCPTEALSFSMSKKNAVKREKAAREKKVWDFSWGEEILMVVAFAVFFVIYKNLYRAVPLLLAIAIAAILAYVLLLAVRMIARKAVTFQRLQLKRDGRITRGGVLFAGFAVLMIAASAHSAFIQVKTSQFAAQFDESQRLHSEGDLAARDAAINEARQHASVLAQWSPIEVRGVNRMLGEMHRRQSNFEQAIIAFEREQQLADRSTWLMTQHALALVAAGRGEEALARIEQAFEKRYPLRQRVLFADTELDRIARTTRDGNIGRPAIAMRLHVLRRAHADDPGDPIIAGRLCDLLMSGPVQEWRDPAEARAVLDAVVERGGEDGAIMGRLARFASMDGDDAKAAQFASRAAELAEAAGDADLAAAMREDAATYRQLAEQK